MRTHGHEHYREGEMKEVLTRGKNEATKGWCGGVWGGFLWREWQGDCEADEEDPCFGTAAARVAG